MTYLKVQGAATRLILGRDSYYYVNGVKHKHNSTARNIMCKLPSISDVLYRNDVVLLHKCLLGIVDLSVISDNRISIRSKPASLCGSDRTQLVVPLINAAYYNNSHFPRSVNSYSF
jgi:hypothetical protein